MNGSRFFILADNLGVFALYLVLINFPQIRVDGLEPVTNDKCYL